VKNVIRIYAFKNAQNIQNNSLDRSFFGYVSEEYIQLFENKEFRKTFGPMTHEVNNS